MLPAIISAVSGMILFMLWVVTATSWPSATEEQKAKATKVLPYVAGVFVLATAVNLFYQFKPDPSKKTVVESSSTAI